MESASPDGTATRGVRIVNVSEGERVVTAVRIGDDDAGNGGGGGDIQTEPGAGTEQDSSSETNGG
jgi:DNA gyrase subunit A